MTDGMETEARWEYATVGIIGAGYRCVSFCGLQGEIVEYRISYLEVLEIVGLLGGIGWELVSIQHHDSEHGLSDFLCIAYLKRCVVAGRAVNEPTALIVELEERERVRREEREKEARQRRG